MPPLPDYQQALDFALQSSRGLGRIVTVNLDDAGGRVLAEPVTADRDLPPFDRAQMDGYAIRFADWQNGKAWPVAGTVPAGSSAFIDVPIGSCVEIATGAPLPRGLDTVIQHELSDRGDRAGKPVRFAVDQVQRGHAVHPRGSDARAGTALIPAATMLGPHHLGIAASVGCSSLNVIARPRVIVLTSGDEVVSPASSALPHQIRNSNGPMVHGLMHRFGADVIRAEHLPDDPQQTLDAVRRGLSDCDLLITVGGVSAGDRDFFPAALRECGVVFSLEGASIQPGKPVMAGRVSGGTGPMTISLPGNPVSVLACACLFAWPSVRVMLGLDASLPWRTVQLSQPVKPNANRRAFRPAILEADGRIRIPDWAGSGDLSHTSPTHGLAELPVRSAAVIAGDTVRFLSWP